MPAWDVLLYKSVQGWLSGRDLIEEREIEADAVLGRLPSVTMEGFTFDGWWVVDESYEGKMVDAYKSRVDADTIVTGDMVICGKWIANTYYIGFDANGGSGTMADQVFVYDAAKSLTANGFTRAGYAFAGWAMSADGAVVYADGTGVANLVSSGAVTLYARWMRIGGNAYAITFNANGGTEVMEPQMYERGRVYKLPQCGFAKPKDKTRFAGWAGSNGRRYDDEMMVFNLGDVTMTAIWE